MNQQQSESTKFKPNPVSTANVFSRVTFWWLRHFFGLGMRGPIGLGDIYDLKKHLDSESITNRFEENWGEQLKCKNPSIIRACFRDFGVPIILWGLVFSFIETLFRVIQPLCLGGLVAYFAPGQTEYTKSDAYLFTGGILMSSFYTVLAFHPFILWIQERACNLRNGCSGLIYKKALALPKSAVTEGLNGKMINILSNDLMRFELALAFLHDVWKGPLESILFTYFMYREIGISAIFGVAFLLSFIPLQAWIGTKSATLRMKTTKRTDHRVKIMNEIIMGIQVIKMYAWELSFATLVDKVRRKEVNAIRQSSHLYALLFSFSMISRVSIFISLLSYIYLGSYITARKVFIVSSYFSILNLSMVFFWPYALTTVGEGYVSFKRVQEFLLMSEQKQMHEDEDDDEKSKKLKNYRRKNIVSNGNTAEKNGTVVEEGQKLTLHREVIKDSTEKRIVLKNATAYWMAGDESSIGIKNINLTIGAGEFCAVVGQVGAGKSTLLQVILGELEVDSGNVQIYGSVSYAAQEAWLFEGTVRSNIIFVEEYDEARYNEVIKVCALERDFKLLPFGDQSIVGERGISLSGGQKARVSLARAIYKKADIYLLDDPLSAVDTHVGKHMYQECIERYLHDKIRILVTHQMQHLTSVKKMVVMSRATIDVQGTYAELRAMKLDSLSSLPEDVTGEESAEKKRTRTRTISSSSNLDELGDEDDIDRTEQQGSGSVSLEVYKKYYRAMNGFLWVMFLFIFAQVGMTGVDFFVAEWVTWEEEIALRHVNSSIDAFSLNTTQEMFGNETQSLLNYTLTSFEEEAQTRNYVVISYSVLLVVATLVYTYRTFHFYTVCLRASIYLHDLLFRGITAAPMFFYNTNPSGRILNRFSKDIGNVDTTLPRSMMDCISALLELAAIAVVVVIVNYWLLLPTLAMSVILYIMRKYYINTLRSVKRIESITFSPIYSHANATMQGLSTVRAFGANEILQNEFYRLLDTNSAVWYMKMVVTRAFAFWLDIVCVLYISVVTLSFLVLDVKEGQSGNVGLAILQCINMIGMCQWGMRQTAEVESQMTSVERIMEYADLPPEPEPKETARLRPNWPETGLIQLQHLSFRYSPESPFVLKDIDVCFEAGHKVGIVGRTGAGKSSIIQALFRLAELDGVIKINGVDTSTVRLHSLRKKISIIPQDPVLFSGTLRFNLDPFGNQSDEDLWNALAQVELKTFVASLTGALNCAMSDGGSNFSVGQRQLVCLARAILRKNNILIMDEATANVDPETDKLIQTTIRDRFQNCTVLTIAHRLHTVMDNDRILVVDAGRAVQFGHPFELLQDEGEFKQLIEQTGVQTSALLSKIAEENYNKETVAPKDLSLDLDFMDIHVHGTDT